MELYVGVKQRRQGAFLVVSTTVLKESLLLKSFFINILSTLSYRADTRDRGDTVSPELIVFHSMPNSSDLRLLFFRLHFT